MCVCDSMSLCVCVFIYSFSSCVKIRVKSPSPPAAGSLLALVTLRLLPVPLEGQWLSTGDGHINSASVMLPKTTQKWEHRMDPCSLSRAAERTHLLCTFRTIFWLISPRESGGMKVYEETKH